MCMCSVWIWCARARIGLAVNVQPLLRGSNKNGNHLTGVRHSTTETLIEKTQKFSVDLSISNRTVQFRDHNQVDWIEFTIWNICGINQFFCCPQYHLFLSDNYEIKFSSLQIEFNFGLNLWIIRFSPFFLKKWSSFGTIFQRKFKNYCWFWFKISSDVNKSPNFFFFFRFHRHSNNDLDRHIDPLSKKKNEIL